MVSDQLQRLLDFREHNYQYVHKYLYYKRYQFLPRIFTVAFFNSCSSVTGCPSIWFPFIAQSLPCNLLILKRTFILPLSWTFRQLIVPPYLPIRRARKADKIDTVSTTSCSIAPISAGMIPVLAISISKTQIKFRLIQIVWQFSWYLG